ncbi:hypothetical protein SISNIDRAFT_552414 [Sistotremastrum niveocremeum HHB9708]|uniref:DUF6535 domain-containing protein n=1 Tax=Sistotremastrum niveocremeum HHB9708 TaxID=1314777 RepID=A0A164PJ86_9AGAM|nr:hypothetical protein SISNIDRAFT_552414 [Sistotremastrum niveocremeum HHB9708]
MSDLHAASTSGLGLSFPEPHINESGRAINLLNSNFGALLDAVRELNFTMGSQRSAMEGMKVTMEGMKTAMLDQATKLDILTKDALKNDQPYDEKEPDDESTCTALYEIATEKTRQKAEQWNGVIDVTLIFIALFSAVLTAFLIPASQALSPSPANSTSTPSDPVPLPPMSDEIVCATYYLSLITAIIVAVLCVLGRQWVRRLTVMPDVQSWKAKTIWHLERMRIAEGEIKVLMQIVYWSLLSSIGVFVAGLLYQLWNLATSFDSTAKILLATWGVGLFLASAIVFTMIATTYHAIRYEGSVFEGLLSQMVVKTVLSGGRKLPETGTQGRLMQLLNRAHQWIQGLRIRVQYNSMSEFFNTYLVLIAEASDPMLLERAVGSLSYSKWIQYGDGTLDHLEKAYIRLMSTDTSVRVQQTVNAQISRLGSWIRERRQKRERDQEARRHDRSWMERNKSHQSDLDRMKEIEKREGEEDAEHARRLLGLTTFLLRQRAHPLYRSFTVSTTNSSDILEFLSLSFDECIARCLCLHDLDYHLGDSRRIVREAFNHCNSLLQSGQDDDLRRIFSHVDHLSVIRSFIRSPIDDESQAPLLAPVIEFIVRHRRDEVLRHINDFLPRPSIDINADCLSKLILILAGPRAQINPDINISNIVANISQHLSWVYWRDVSHVLITYLKDRPIGNLENLHGIHDFLQLCVRKDWRSPDGHKYATREETSECAQSFLEENGTLFATVLGLDRGQSSRERGRYRPRNPDHTESRHSSPRNPNIHLPASGSTHVESRKSSPRNTPAAAPSANSPSADSMSLSEQSRSDVQDIVRIADQSKPPTPTPRSVSKPLPKSSLHLDIDGEI